MIRASVAKLKETVGLLLADAEEEQGFVTAAPAVPVRWYRRVPAAFDELVAGCLKPDPTRRPTIDELARSLKALA